MLTLFQSIVLGLMQGVTELFPISSLGHSVILPSFLGWHIDQGHPAFITFIVVTHVATAITLFFYYFEDWKKIVAGVIRSLKARRIKLEDTYARIGWLIVVATVPVGFFGILFEKQFSALFAVPLFAGTFLIGNGILLYGAELLIRRRMLTEAQSDERIARMRYRDAVKIGFMQCLALFPGFSRTGASLAGGLIVGLTHEDAAHFAFLLATPIIFAAGVLKIPELTLSGEAFDIMSFAIGAVVSALGAYFAVRFLTRYFKTKTLTPFAIYCFLIGLAAVLINFL